MKSLFAILCITSLLGQELLEPVILPMQQTSALEELQSPTPTFDLPRKSSFTTVGLSSLMPGLGQAYLGDVKTATALMTTTYLGLAAAFWNRANEQVRMAGVLTLQTVSGYGLYSAYRDVRLYNKDIGYKYKMPTDGFLDIASAPFRPSVLKKPEVWGGFLGAIAVATGIAYLSAQSEARLRLDISSALDSPWIALPVGIGEESLFRGYLQSQLSESLTPWGGIIVSSLAFGAAHIPNAQWMESEDRRSYYTFSLPLITGLGVYMGWLTHKNHSLKESVALHTWYDFTLLGLSSLASQAAVTQQRRFAISIPLIF